MIWHNFVLLSMSKSGQLASSWTSNPAPVAATVKRQGCIEQLVASTSGISARNISSSDPAYYGASITALLSSGPIVALMWTLTRQLRHAAGMPFQPRDTGIIAAWQAPGTAAALAARGRFCISLRGCSQSTCQRAQPLYQPYRRFGLWTGKETTDQQSHSDMSGGVLCRWCCTDLSTASPFRDHRLQWLCATQCEPRAYMGAGLPPVIPWQSKVCACRHSTIRLVNCQFFCLWLVGTLRTFSGSRPHLAY